MLEAEAKKKVCMFKLGNKEGKTPGYRCEGSECMGWDWFAKTWIHENGSVTDRADMVNNPGNFKDGISMYTEQPAQGDCRMKTETFECQAHY